MFLGIMLTVLHDSQKSSHSHESSELKLNLPKYICVITVLSLAVVLIDKIKSHNIKVVLFISHVIYVCLIMVTWGSRQGGNEK